MVAVLSPKGVPLHQSDRPKNLSKNPETCAAARDFGIGQYGESRVSLWRAMADEPSQALAKRFAANSLYNFRTRSNPHYSSLIR